MGVRSIYFCDICGKDLEDFDPNIAFDPSRKLTTSVGDKEIGIVVEHKDICSTCFASLKTKIEATNEVVKK